MIKIMHPKEYISKIMKLIAGDTRQTIVSILVTSLIVGYGGLLYLSKTVLEISLLLLNIQTPLWATILLIGLCCLYSYVKVSAIHRQLIEMDQSYSLPPQLPIQEEKTILSEMHEKILNLLFKEASPVITICKAHNLALEEANYYLGDLYSKNMVHPPAAYTGHGEWYISQGGREYIMNKRAIS